MEHTYSLPSQPPQFFGAESLLERLWAPGSRPSLRWLRGQQQKRAFPYYRLGSRVFFRAEEVAAHLFVLTPASKASKNKPIIMGGEVERHEPWTGQYVQAQGLLSALWPDKRCRPCLRWLRAQQKRGMPRRRSSNGRLVYFNPLEVAIWIERFRVDPK